MSVIGHQTEKEWISANEKSRQRMSQTQAEGAAKQHAARLEEAHLRAHHSCFTTSERFDTGSQVTLTKESVWNQLGSPLINSGNILTCFGLSKTHVIGSFNSTVSNDNQDFPVQINVVPNHSMNFDIIIGCNLIKQSNLTITPDSVMFSKPQIEVSDASPQSFVFAITDDIPKFDIGPEIPKQTRNDVEALLVSYRPNKN
ncbi:peptidase A2 domain-containing protein [Trichonephila clavipes]|nr:peptidase A2 domain-containing protein [Trichonephila clavipes]